MKSPPEIANALMYYIVDILYNPRNAPINAIGITFALFDNLANGKLTNFSENPLQNLEQNISVPTNISPDVN